MGPKEREIKRRLRVLEHAKKIGNVRMTCRYFGLSRSTFDRWKTKYDKQGESGLANKSTAARNHPRKVPAEIVGKIVHLRCKYHLGPIRIVWYLERYHNIRVSDSTVYRTLLTAFLATWVAVKSIPSDIRNRCHEFQAKFHRPHGAFAGKTPYEILRDRLQ